MGPDSLIKDLKSNHCNIIIMRTADSANADTSPTCM